MLRVNKYALFIRCKLQSNRTKQQITYDMIVLPAVSIQKELNTSDTEQFWLHRFSSNSVGSRVSIRINIYLAMHRYFEWS